MYDRAFVHLRKHAYEAALADYRKTLELSPRGYFVAVTAADMLTREAAGEFPPGLYAAFVLRASNRTQLRRIRVPVLDLHPGFQAFQAIRADEFLQIFWTFRTTCMFKSSLPQNQPK